MSNPHCLHEQSPLPDTPTRRAPRAKSRPVSSTSPLFSRDAVPRDHYIQHCLGNVLLTLLQGRRNVFGSVCVCGGGATYQLGLTVNCLIRPTCQLGLVAAAPVLQDFHPGEKVCVCVCVCGGGMAPLAPRFLRPCRLL